MKTEPNTKHVEGGSPTHSGPKGKEKQEDDSMVPPKTLEKEAVRDSEQKNMNDNEGYNETPPTVPVQKGKE
ncbi:hypothetical protein [Dyadobacter sandarakinus]|uniref:Uncharacterized protein n=1 Tax=Dyadobacter sandarakinus TaxID=2747268 RepID=A0ABX7I5I4_9BACT|nr:hypothetical protein [Dyadobacter sandarakinus]QRR01205.1 hypothetical protein HWI92_09955 [Dyadobacter sandarakinus]